MSVTVRMKKIQIDLFYVAKKFCKLCRKSLSLEIYLCVCVYMDWCESKEREGIELFPCLKYYK